MTNFRMALLDLLRKDEQGSDPQFLRDGLRLLAQELMDAEVTEAIGAAPYERSEKRVTAREREWDTRVGTIELAIPKLRQGTYFPTLLEPRRRHERALLAVVQEAYVQGVSTRNVDALAQALGLNGISKDQVSRICKELDGQVHAFRTRPLSGDYPYLMLDATFEKVRENGRVVSMAVVIAVGVRSSGEREVLGTDVGPAEDLECWLEFLRQLMSRGLRGVRLVTSDSHLGLKQAVAQVLTGATWQRCRVHFMRNALSTVPKAAQQMVAATLRTIFAQPDRAGRPGNHRADLTTLRATLPQAGRGPARGRGRHPRFSQFPARAPPADLVDQRARASQPGSGSSLRGRRHLSQPAGAVAPCGCPPRGAERRMGGRPPLLQSGVNAQAAGTKSGGGGQDTARAADSIMTAEQHAGFYTTSRDVTRHGYAGGSRRLVIG
jgi:transposase-like protein